MAGFTLQKLSSKSAIKISSALSFTWSAVLATIVLLSLKLQFPFDIVNNPVTGVEILTVIVSVVHVLFSVVLSVACGDPSPKLRNVVKCTLGIACACATSHALAILFGAPALESSRETFHFAMLVTCLTVVPACCVLGADGDKWTHIYALGRPALGKETVIYVTSITSVFGAWLGAVPIPLDWDRPWQIWPVSCVLGTLFGYCIGLLLAAVYLPLKYRQLHKTKIT